VPRVTTEGCTSPDPGITQAVILAAGNGTRLGLPPGVPKLLARVVGRTLLEHQLVTLGAAGVRDIVLVTGYGSDAVEDFVKRKGLGDGDPITIVNNPHWRLGNAWSLWAARGLVANRFLLAMGDHLVDPRVVQRLVVQGGNLCVAADSSPQHVEVSEATKIALSAGRVVAVGKSLDPFDAVDMGFFVATRNMFPVLRECLAAGPCSLNEAKEAWIRAGNEMWAVDCSSSFWLDVDTPADRTRAEKLLRQRLAKDRDGLVARLVNRPLSTRLSGWLVNRPVSSNQLTMSSFSLSALAAALLATGTPLLAASGGLLSQAASIMDGCDGEVARLRGTATPGGAVFDAVLDRLADAVVIAGLVWGARSAGAGDGTLVLGALALSGSLILSYSESRFESAFGRPLPAGGARIPATRDVRVFLIMLGGLFNAAPLALAAIAALSGAEITRRLRQAVALAAPASLAAG